MKHYYKLLLALLLGSLSAQGQTVGLAQHDAGSLDDGYVLFAPLASTNTYLIDKCGRQVKTWTSAYTPGASVYLLEDGSLLRTGNVGNTIFNAGGTGGIVEKYDWDGNLVWSYLISDATKCHHHDVKALPNGNILVIAWESKTQEEAIASGRIPTQVGATLWSEQILEIQPVGPTGGNVVWEWHLWDHLVQNFDNTKSNYGNINEHPELFDVNYNSFAEQTDWIHLNAIDYNPTLDQIMLSSFTAGEIWILDHSTTTAEAASHTGGNSGKGGDLLYRLGNPSTYGGDTAGNILFYGQHNAHWIKSGLPFENKIIVYNNGNGRVGGNYSTVHIVDPPITGHTYDLSYPIMPTADSWLYNDGNPNNLYSPFISGAQQLSNGNVLICDGPAGVFFEVNNAGETVWKYRNPVNAAGPITQGEVPTVTFTFRCSYYPSDYSGFAGHTLVAGDPIENANVLTENCSLNLAVVNPQQAANVVVYPNPVRDVLHINLPDSWEYPSVTLINALGQHVYSTRPSGHAVSMDVSAFAAGLYYLKVTAGSQSFTKKIAID